MSPPLIYRRDALLKVLGISKSTLRNWMLTEDFPHPVQLGPRAVGWSATQVHAWLEKRPTVSPFELQDA
ncbi:helix-turn-helix transcriptional regulator [Comamonas nitrativorans]|uniref:Helix-turn-helix transcriptional regulator n=1 Tax=Comamonas nitrativorans TaxID=108437 RepID=A0ABV9H0H6_9BURK